MESKQKVLLVHNFYKIGGGEHTVYENERRLLQEHGHEVYTYTRDNHELDTSLTKKLLLPFTTVFSFKTFREAKSLIQEKHIDLVHCHNTFPLISPSIYYAAQSCGIPILQTIHNFRFLCPCGIFYRNGQICEDCVNNGLHCAIQHGCYRQSKLQTAVVVNMLWLHRKMGTYQKIHYIFLTEFNRQKFQKLLGTHLKTEFVKPNFEYVNIQPAPQKCIHHRRYVFVGRLDESKGIGFLLKVWAKAKGRELVIFGSGAMEPQVKNAAAKNAKIIFKGFQNRETILKELSTAEAMIFSSEWYEGFSMTLIEAFAAGTPVVCSNIGNSADIVQNAKAGCLYKLYDAEDFIRQIENIERKNTEFRTNARRAYEQFYTPDKNYEILKHIYDKVCESNHERTAG
ncbi:MAG: glycosyltransferase family 4 protein [Oscillospiraceae bacterium]|nr:glycosyltransferase family 4 protein [Oscillospiraceae bacterium]